MLLHFICWQIHHRGRALYVFALGALAAWLLAGPGWILMAALVLGAVQAGIFAERLRGEIRWHWRFIRPRGRVWWYFAPPDEND